MMSIVVDATSSTVRAGEGVQGGGRTRVCATQKTCSSVTVGGPV